MSKPLVSIIIPVYNAEFFVAETLDSVLAQTLTKHEVILVDDGSTDDSLAILERYKERDSRIKVFSQKNAGVSAARNFGVSMSSADMIAFLDSDDVAVADRLEAQCAYFEAHPGIDVLGGAMEEIDTSGKPLGLRYFPPTDDATIRQRLLHSSPLVTSTVMIRRSVYLNAGGFRSVFTLSEDFDLWTRLMPFAHFANLPKILVRYHVHAASVTHSRLLIHALTTPAVIALMQLRRQGLPDPADSPLITLPELLDKLGFDEKKIIELQSEFLVRSAGNMLMRGMPDMAEGNLRLLDGLSTTPEIKTKIASDLAIVRARIFLRRGKFISMASVLLSASLHHPIQMLRVASCKLWRLLFRRIN